MKKHLLITTLLIITSACNSSETEEPELHNPSIQKTRTEESSGIKEDLTTPSPSLPQTETAIPSDTPPPSPTPLPDYEDSIVFVSDRDGDDDIYLMDSNGNNVTKLTDNNNSDTYPRWTHDKTRLLYVSRIIPTTHIFVMYPDGSGKTNITPDLPRIGQCEWSPISYMIACISYEEEGPGENLIIIDADSLRTTTIFSSVGRIFDIAWSPDGEKIALALSEIGGLLIYNLQDDSIQEFFLGDGFSQQVAWSKNGNRLAYSFGPAVQGDFATIHTVKADGSNPKRWVEIGGPEWVQSFSPTDEFVLLESARDGLFEIFVFNLESKELIQLTDNETTDRREAYVNYSPIYSEDGSKILFVSRRDGDSEIYVMNSDGTTQINLTNNEASRPSIIKDKDGTNLAP